MWSAVNGNGRPAEPVSQSFDSIAQFRPEVYYAFEKAAVHRTARGAIEVRLTDGTCRNHHVPEFLLCLQCWMYRGYGDPALTGRPWRLRCLNLARNSLRSATMRTLMEGLVRMDIRIERLHFTCNCFGAEGLDALTDYLWNCPDPVIEVDITENSAGAGGIAALSAMLRCIYNHPAYPHTACKPGGEVRITPFVLRVGGNGIAEPEAILRTVEEKGGKEHVWFRLDPAAFAPEAREVQHARARVFLAAWVPDIMDQQPQERPVGEEAVPPAKRRRPHLQVRSSGSATSTSARRRLIAVKQELREERREGSHSTSSAARSNAAPSLLVPKTEEEPKDGTSVEPPRVPLPHPPPPPASPAVAPSAVGRTPVARKEGQVDADVWLPPPLDEVEQTALKQEVVRCLTDLGGVPTVAAGNMLAELVTCMVASTLRPCDMEAELSEFLGVHAGTFVQWLIAHLCKMYMEKLAALGLSST
eukprot:NODE_2519_length_2197_cov_5.341063.p1 GENE.NODE_2519_length_2197_cov_5.341063~~NODE_2519_length_2197_cov_5.341063.p1  ORF type:complete len:473 (+),score=79.72 NODE_2519_length_2197_cov_5.341063:166-1584(+)